MHAAPRMCVHAVRALRGSLGGAMQSHPLLDNALLLRCQAPLIQLAEQVVGPAAPTTGMAHLFRVRHTPRCQGRPAHGRPQAHIPLPLDRMVRL